MRVLRPIVFAILPLTCIGAAQQTAKVWPVPEGAAQLMAPLVFKTPVTALQGYATDGKLHFTFDTKAITAWDGEWKQVWKNATPFVGLPDGVGHVGDGESFEGKLYVPVEEYHSCSQFAHQTIAVYSALDGHLLELHDMTGAGQELSSVTIQASTRSIYSTSFCQANQIFRYDLGTFAARVPLNLTEGIAKMQGVSWSETAQKFAVTSDSPDQQEGYVWTVSPVGGVKLLFAAPQAGEMEGVDYTQGQIRYTRNHVWFLDTVFSR